MKIKFLAGLLIVGAGIFWWLFPNRSYEKESRPPTANALAAKPSILQSTAPTLSQQTQSLFSVESNPPASDTVDDYVKHKLADPQYDWKMPVNFWGRVVDESNSIVADAGVHFQWTDISENGTSEADAKSDGNGFFSLTDKRGKRLCITVDKKGYYKTASSLQCFEYANPADGLFKPDRGNPAVFRLRKKGVGVDLITSQYGMNGDFIIYPPTNGTPVFVDLLNRKVGDTGQIKIEGWKTRKSIKTGQGDWSFRLTVPDGGFVENNDEFPFEAPDADYPSVIEWHFAVGKPDWVAYIKKKFYIKFGNPPRYGTISVDTSAFSPSVDLQYAVNPDGSRNLEPK